MLSHAGHLRVEDIVPDTFLGHESALYGCERCGDELSLGLEPPPEGEDLSLEETFELDRLALGEFEYDRTCLRHGRRMDGFFTYHLSLEKCFHELGTGWSRNLMVEPPDAIQCAFVHVGIN